VRAATEIRERGTFSALGDAISSKELETMFS
jgi:hypothetical protein